jgi:hypothetical protein
MCVAAGPHRRSIHSAVMRTIDISLRRRTEVGVLHNKFCAVTLCGSRTAFRKQVGEINIDGSY